ncbi:alpha/beta fold hydrolase [Anaerosporobacter sp.]
MKQVKQFGKNLLFWVPVIVVCWLLINYVEDNYEKGIYKAPGEMVEIYGKKMHVYSKGKGKNTIVLLPRLGTAAPVLDFRPLAEELSKKNRVVVIEPFGYGYSEKTDRARTVENITQEIHLALEDIGVKGKIVLMPHSEAGIYAIYYTNRYPEQVKAIVGIDCTLPNMKVYIGNHYKKTSKIMKYAEVLGISRLEVTINPSKYLPDESNHAYTKKDRKIMKAITIWNYYNENVLEERNYLDANIETTSDIQLNEKLPVLFFYGKGSKVSEDYDEYTRHLEYSEVVILEGNHYLHWNNYKEIARKTTDFLSKQ